MFSTLLPLPVGNGVRVPVVVDTDIGSNVDDLLALPFTLGINTLDLVGVTTVYGDTVLRAKVAQSALALAEPFDVPVGTSAGSWVMSRTLGP